MNDKKKPDSPSRTSILSIERAGVQSAHSTSIQRSHDHAHCHHHGHHHGHFSHDAKDVTLKKLVKATALNVILSLIMFAGAYYSSSVGLAADAVHNLSDALALVIAYGAIKWSMRPANSEYTFGYGAAEGLGTFANSLFLLGVGGFLVIEAIDRWFNPVQVHFQLAMIVAGVALIIDLWTVWLLWRHQESENLRAAMLHNVSDAMASVVVLISGWFGYSFGWFRIDSVATLLISAYIFYHTWPLLKSSVRQLMRAAPSQLNSDEIVTSLKLEFSSVLDVHHVHMWQLSEKEWSFEAHVVVDIESVSVLMDLKQKLKTWLVVQGIEHSTLEFEQNSVECLSRNHET